MTSGSEDDRGICVKKDMQIKQRHLMDYLALRQ